MGALVAESGSVLAEGCAIETLLVPLFVSVKASDSEVGPKADSSVVEAGGGEGGEGGGGRGGR